MPFQTLQKFNDICKLHRITYTQVSPFDRKRILQMKMLSIAAAFVAAMTIPVAANAAPCKDAKGHFVKCPPPAAALPITPPARPMTRPTPMAAAPHAAATVQRCRDGKGHFIKCPRPVTAAGSASTSRCRNSKGQFAKCGTSGARPSH